MLGRLQDYGGWEDASHVKLTLHRSAKAIVRHTWRDICMSQRMQDAASIDRRVRRKSQNSIENCGTIRICACGQDAGRYDSITRCHAGHDEYTLCSAQKIESRNEIASSV